MLGGKKREEQCFRAPDSRARVAHILLHAPSVCSGSSLAVFTLAGQRPGLFAVSKPCWVPQVAKWTCPHPSRCPDAKHQPWPTARIAVARLDTTPKCAVGWTLVSVALFLATAGARSRRERSAPFAVTRDPAPELARTCDGVRRLTRHGLHLSATEAARPPQALASWRACDGRVPRVVVRSLGQRDCKHDERGGIEP